MRGTLALWTAVLPLVIAVPGTYLQAPAPPRKCEWVASLVRGLHGDAGGSKFCSNVLHLTRKTVTVHTTTTQPLSTSTVTGGVTTTTATVTDISTGTITQTVTDTSTSTKTVTCTPSAPPKKRGLEEEGALLAERNPAPAKTPACLRGQPAASVMAACSCLGLPPPKPTTVTVTDSCAAKTTTITSTSTETDTTTVFSDTTYSTVTATASTSTTVTQSIIFGTAPQHTATSNAGNTVFNQYPNVDFWGYDLGGCSCDPSGGSGQCRIGNDQVYDCTTFVDCQNVCAQMNDHAQHAACVGVTWATNGADHKGICYPKYSIPTHNLKGCGVYQTTYRVDSAVLMFDDYYYPDPLPPESS